MSNIKVCEIDHINVHATSTEAGDEIEANSIKTVLGQHSCKPTVSALKSYLGHTFAAAGAIETILGLLSMRDVPILLLLVNRP
jgi:3-oxoacyl-[acyl-carrier-protein] synthase II